MSEKRKEDWIKIVQPDNSDKIASPQYIKKLLGFDDIWSSIDSLRAQVFSLQDACLPQLAAYCKNNILYHITENYQKKAFKDAPIRREFERYYNWRAILEALKLLVKEGKLTYRRGWYRLAPATEKKEVV